MAVQSLSAPYECTPFSSNAPGSWLRATSNNVPRYLFRVYTPNSGGLTNRKWAMSMEAAHERQSEIPVDVCSRRASVIADELADHLRWTYHRSFSPFVSWTSSLLVAILYMFNRYSTDSNGATLNDIHLCVIDTSLFPKRVFLRDMDLISPLSPHNQRLARLGNLRLGNYGTAHYNGEFLSQGSLKIQDRCQVVTLQQLISNGLFDLQPKFIAYLDWRREEKTPWSTVILDYRSLFTPDFQADPPGPRALDSALRLGSLFENNLGFRFSMAMSFLALLPPSLLDSRFLDAVQRSNIYFELPLEERLSNIRVFTHQALAEAKRFQDILFLIDRQLEPLRDKYLEHLEETEIEEVAQWFAYYSQRNLVTNSVTSIRLSD
ncbi:unnamed protein product [Clonostachys solani]|uniref:DUF7587 domain-containing protein n=1 Tax=Clonostachys solani TaxID=160281 RepID=A0A9N9ZFS5_9HYPO|nr:unnamed protein product [Clonostachys solani]